MPRHRKHQRNKPSQRCTVTAQSYLERTFKEITDKKYNEPPKKNDISLIGNVEPNRNLGGVDYLLNMDIAMDSIGFLNGRLEKIKKKEFQTGDSEKNAKNKKSEEEQTPDTSGRQLGESYYDFKKRINSEAHEKLLRETKCKTTSQKTKTVAFRLRQRERERRKVDVAKRRARKKRGEDSDDNTESEEEGNSDTTHPLRPPESDGYSKRKMLKQKDTVRFGDVAKAPPAKLAHLTRKIEEKKLKATVTEENKKASISEKGLNSSAARTVDSNGNTTDIASYLANVRIAYHLLKQRRQMNLTDPGNTTSKQNQNSNKNKKSRTQWDFNQAALLSNSSEWVGKGRFRRQDSDSE